MLLSASYAWRTKPPLKLPKMPEHQRPSVDFLLLEMISLVIVAVGIIISFKRLHHKGRSELVRAWGVSMSKVKRSVNELRRKGFHLAGLLVPMTHLILLRAGYPNSFCSRLCWTITIVGTSMDFTRLHVAFVARNWPLRSILRENEHKQLTGGCYFSLGCTIAICASHAAASAAAATSCRTSPQPARARHRRRRPRRLSAAVRHAPATLDIGPPSRSLRSGVTSSGCDGLDPLFGAGRHVRDLVLIRRPLGRPAAASPCPAVLRPHPGRCVSRPPPQDRGHHRRELRRRRAGRAQIWP